MFSKNKNNLWQPCHLSRLYFSFYITITEQQFCKITAPQKINKVAKKNYLIKAKLKPLMKLNMPAML